MDLNWVLLARSGGRKATFSNRADKFAPIASVGRVGYVDPVAEIRAGFYRGLG
jgi:hypothetical protein